MKKHFLLLGAIAVCGCEKHQPAYSPPEEIREASFPVGSQYNQPKQAFPQPQPMRDFSQPVTGRFVKPTDVLNAEEAMTANDISLLRRAGYGEAQILESVKRQGLVSFIGDAEGRDLMANGITPDLLRELRNFDYVLTDYERQRYFARLANRQNRGGTEAQPRPSGNVESADDAENRRQLALQRQILRNAREATAKKEQREERMDQETRAEWLSRDWNNKHSGTYQTQGFNPNIRRSTPY